MNQFYIAYPEGKIKALTLSYDDGNIADRKLVALFNRYGLKATFNLISGTFEETEANQAEFVRQSEVASLYQKHEVACHTVTHPWLTRTPIDKLAGEILQDRETLETTVGYPVQGFAYPYGSYSDEIKSLLPFVGIAYARKVADTDQFEVPEDYFDWAPTCHHDHQLLENAQKFLDFDDPHDHHLRLMSVWGHSYEFERNDNWAHIEEFAELISGRTDIWYVTNIDFKRYMTAAKNLVFSINGNRIFNSSAISVWVQVNNGTAIEVKPGLNTIEI